MPVFVITHKLFDRKLSSHYVPFYIGSDVRDRADDLGFLTDISIDKNLSSKQKNYSELTALYSIMQMPSEDGVKGLVHYRRYFVDVPQPLYKIIRKILHLNIGVGVIRRILSFFEDISFTKIQSLLNDCDVILPVTRTFTMSVAYAYAKNHFLSDLEIARNVIKNKYPDYLFAFDVCIHNSELHLFNMIIAKEGVLNDYARKVV